MLDPKLIKLLEKYNHIEFYGFRNGGWLRVHLHIVKGFFTEKDLKLIDELKQDGWEFHSLYGKEGKVHMVFLKEIKLKEVELNE